MRYIITIFLSLILFTDLIGQENSHSLKLKIGSFSPSKLSHDDLDIGQELLEQKLLFYGSSPDQFKLNTHDGAIELIINNVPLNIALSERLEGVGEMRIMAVHRFGDGQQMEQLFKKLQSYTSDISGSTVSSKNIIELNTTTVPGMDFRKFPPAVIGMVDATDVPEVKLMLKTDEIQSLLPENSVFSWAATSSKLHKDQYDLYLVDINPNYSVGVNAIEQIEIRSETNRFSRTRDIIDIWIDNEATEALKILTGKNIGRELVIMLDKNVLTAPLVEGAILDGNLQIEGSFEGPTTRALTNILKMVILEQPLELLDITMIRK